MEYALAVLVLATVVALVVAAPLRAGARLGAAEDARRAELEAAKQAKYREIRDAELDYRMGKLSEDDYRVTDRELRGQAIAILERLDRLESPTESPVPEGASAPAEPSADGQPASDPASPPR